MYSGDERWVAVDAYFSEKLAPQDDALLAVLHANAAAGLPPHDVSPLQGKLLALLARLTASSRVLEIGTLGGYSTIWFARAVPSHGRVITLELSEDFAAVARANIQRAGVGEKVEIIVGSALESLAHLVAQGAEPFDLIFIDADKPNNPAYLDLSLIHI